MRACARCIMCATCAEPHGFSTPKSQNTYQYLLQKQFFSCKRINNYINNKLDFKRIATLLAAIHFGCRSATAMSSGIFVRLIISEGSNTLMNQLIIITDNSETAGTIIYPRFTSLGKDKRCIEAITVQPSNSDINEVRDQISVVNLKEFWIGTYPNLHVKLSKWWLGKQPINAFSLMIRMRKKCER